jgi:serine/threonine protein kinase
MKGRLSVRGSIRSLPGELRRVESSSLAVGSKVGSGSQAEVFEGALEGKQVAVKRIDSSRLKHNSRSRTDLVRELMIMGKTSHPNLVQLLGTCEQPRVKSIDILLEFCRGGTLFELLHIDDVDLVIWQQHTMATDVALGMGYLHRFNPQIIHRDLKSLNVLLADPVHSVHDIPHVKIADFGFAKMAVSKWTGSAGAEVQAESGIPSVAHTSSMMSEMSTSTSPHRDGASMYSDAPKRAGCTPKGNRPIETSAFSGSGQSLENPEMRARCSDVVGLTTTGSSLSYVCPGFTIDTCGTAMTAGVGTLQWMAPELMSGSTNYTSKVDVYAFGMLLFEIMCREPPFVDFDKGELRALVTKGVRPEVPPDVPRFYIRMSESCWDSDPSLRPDFDSLILDLQEYGQLKFSSTH